MTAAPRRISLTGWILIAMLLGILLGWANHEWFPEVDLAKSVGPFSTIFISLIKCIVVPLIFGSLVVGIAGHGEDLKQVGRLAFRSILYFEIVTTVALIVGLAAVNLAKPGVGIVLSGTADTGTQLAQTKTTFASVLTHSVPTSFFDAAAQNVVLQVVVFTVI